MITLGSDALGSSSYPAKPGIRGRMIITLKFYFYLIALIILLHILYIIKFFTVQFLLVDEIKN
jgi:hypothetical protein